MLRPLVGHLIFAFKSMLKFLPFEDEVSLDESMEAYAQREASDAALFEEVQGYGIADGFFGEEANAWEALKG